MRWLIPTPGDVLAVVVVFGGLTGLLWLYVKHRPPAEPEGREHPMGNRYRHEGWKP